MSRSLFPIALLLLTLAGCGPTVGRIPPPPEQPDLDYPIGSFALTERDGRTVTEKDLAGKVWVASFVFTRCMGNCPAVTGTVRRLQSELADVPDLMFVTFTVDPKHDRPGELKKYADRYQADPKRWLFLTGDRETIRKLLQERFKQSAGDDPKGDDDAAEALAAHSTRLVVVDKRGVMRGFYDGMPKPDDPEAAARYEDGLKRLKEKVKQLAAE
jgi:cytochrome oxidase Cu insertion factor (SCO1/SenC/PrrC family)